MTFYKITFSAANAHKVIHDLMSYLQDLIPDLIPHQKRRTNISPSPNG
jgi:hypothetical protein